MIEVDVARPIAQGQTIIGTLTPAKCANASAGCGPKSSQKGKVRATNDITPGTNRG